MASPVYNTAAFRRHHGFGGHRRRRWGLGFGSGSILGGNIPPYLGAGQPTSEDDGELIGDGTPVYRTPPSKTAATTPSMTPSGPTAPQPPTAMAPQSATVAAPQSTATAIVVPRS
jgi:hypothetical protein